MPQESFFLSKGDKDQLLKIARTTIEQYLKHGNTIFIKESELSSSLMSPCGAFVTLHNKGELRGCIGRFTSPDALYKVIQKMAISSATQDSRFPKVELKELNEIDIEISVLTPLHKIDSIDEIKMGIHGIYIKKDFSSGTFLPQVAVETGWTKEEFLGYCSKNKVGIGWDGWKNAEIYIYEAIVFEETN